MRLGPAYTQAMRFFTRTDGRYYAIHEPMSDLLGDRVIVTIHGSVHSRLGGVHSYLADTVSVEQLARVRRRHGYVERSDIGIARDTDGQGVSRSPQTQT